MSLLTDRIKNDIKDSMRAGHKARVKVLRMVTAAIKQREIDERIILDESQVLAVLDKMLKQRRDSASQYQAANRVDLASVENSEIAIINEFMPQALNKDEINSLINAAIAQVTAISMQDMGKVMAIIRPQVQGKADMGQVSQIIKTKLSA